jgi:hypothetical protein
MATDYRRTFLGIREATPMTLPTSVVRSGRILDHQAGLSTRLRSAGLTPCLIIPQLRLREVKDVPATQ